MRLPVALLLLLFSPAAMALSIVCADRGYPKELPDPIRYEVSSHPVVAAADARTEVQYVVLLAKRVDGKDLHDVQLQLLEGEAVVLAAPLRVDVHEVADWGDTYAACVRTTEVRRRLRIVATYDPVCRVILRQALSADRAGG